MSTTTINNKSSCRRSSKAARKMNPHVSITDMIEQVMHTTVAEFTRKLLHDKDFFDSASFPLEGEAMEDKVAQAMKVWCEMTQKPKGASFLRYPIGLYAQAPVDSDKDKDTLVSGSGSEPVEKKRTAYQNFCIITRPLVETGTFGEKTCEVARRWRLLSKDEQDAFKTQETENEMNDNDR